MFAVIFEVEPEKENVQEYFDLAVELLPELEKIDGFISVERFTSMYNEGKYLSVSFWRDENALNQWREHLGHRDAQEKGLINIFRNYRIRVAEVIRDYGKDDRKEAP
ncbi:MAG: antibiotic biosynthesis monooxygenase [SAR324 cluster bacterium]|jgi:heme-degrading monooxygenase HmoA|nr:antibiotic biosynthesis monooxygenase [SAR324 cluster bacterium]MDP6521141.1 antibiotic biosynthesis monooxygenase [SAR324 cluster bacterium]|tara:strand:- start:166 stop:486 length:321 start_codon:yes stop_codon:yes gene_type:complete